MFRCNNMKVCVFILFLVGVMGENRFEDGIYKDAVQFVRDCGPKALTLCLKEKALKFVERLPNNIDVGNGIRIKQSNSERLPREYSPVILPNETKEREAALDKVLLERLMDYLGSHTLELKIPTIFGADAENSVEEGRKEGGGGGGGYGGFGGGKKGGKKGKKGGMSTMMMMMMMKSSMLFALGLKAVGALAFKALLIAKVAFTIASIIALKKLVDSKGHTATYEVIAHPHVEEHGHNERAYTPAELVYRGYRTGS